ncbi:hypothetical protein BBS_5 [Burkholderia pseudomallei NAU20B-16]|nr:hypothetical protein BBS_5 [Burkholderia pseudomallei NAU20B-16]
MIAPVVALYAALPPSALATPPPSEFTFASSAITAWFVAYSWLPLIASVLVALTWPAATLMSWRSVPTPPMLTTPLAGLATPA